MFFSRSLSCYHGDHIITLNLRPVFFDVLGFNMVLHIDANILINYGKHIYTKTNSAGNAASVNV